LTRAAVSVERNIAGDGCLDDEKHGHDHHETTLDTGPGVTGAQYLRASSSELPPRARMAILMARTGGHLRHFG
jgi:hypothetical protein